MGENYVKARLIYVDETDIEKGYMKGDIVNIDIDDGHLIVNSEGGSWGYGTDGTDVFFEDQLQFLEIKSKKWAYLVYRSDYEEKEYLGVFPRIAEEKSLIDMVDLLIAKKYGEEYVRVDYDTDEEGDICLTYSDEITPIYIYIHQIDLY